MAKRDRGAASGSLLRLVAIVLIAIFGWHFYASRVVRKEIVARLERDTPGKGAAEVSIHPLTNVATIRLASSRQAAEENKHDPFSALGAAIGSALGGAVAKAMEPAIERDLNTRARELFDLYAMVLAYRVKVVINDASGERT